MINPKQHTFQPRLNHFYLSFLKKNNENENLKVVGEIVIHTYALYE